MQVMDLDGPMTAVHELEVKVMRTCPVKAMLVWGMEMSATFLSRPRQLIANITGITSPSLGGHPVVRASRF